ncbi:Uncharacterized conserved protein [Phaffia rhodozyma]|uniref:Uncharacterized conserved protein n=1 Tax=Phaffia rhodozyma TaxID=264483 RepID=A0A0F7SHT1_PHARH|nr:Uncharacterized conserved protein [Phaffia rhodozyma]
MSLSPSHTSDIIDDQDDWLDDTAVDMTSMSMSGTNLSMADKEWASMDEKFTNDGYREGIPEGKLSTLQPGFDDGFALAAPLARQFGGLKAQTSALLAMLNPPPGLRSKLPPMAALSDSIRDNQIKELKEISKELAVVRMEHLVGRDLEAEEHSKEHGIDIPNEHVGTVGGRCEESKGEKKIDNWNARLEKIKKDIGILVQEELPSSIEIVNS